MIGVVGAGSFGAGGGVCDDGWFGFGFADKD